MTVRGLELYHVSHTLWTWISNGKGGSVERLRPDLDQPMIQPSSYCSRPAEQHRLSTVACSVSLFGRILLFSTAVLVFHRADSQIAFLCPCTAARSHHSTDPHENRRGPRSHLSARPPRLVGPLHEHSGVARLHGELAYNQFEVRRPSRPEHMFPPPAPHKNRWGAGALAESGHRAQKSAA